MYMGFCMKSTTRIVHTCVYANNYCVLLLVCYLVRHVIIVMERGASEELLLVLRRL